MISSAFSTQKHNFVWDLAGLVVMVTAMICGARDKWVALTPKAKHLSEMGQETTTLTSKHQDYLIKIGLCN